MAEISKYQTQDNLTFTITTQNKQQHENKIKIENIYKFTMKSSKSSIKVLVKTELNKYAAWKNKFSDGKTNLLYRFDSFPHPWK